MSEKTSFFWGVVLVGTLFVAAPPAMSQQTIVGQDNPAVDVPAVQKAVDQGGTIILKGTFDFGEKGQVRIGKDVMILGEKSQGQYLTKIKGGFGTIHSPLPAQLPPQAPGPKITIRNIHFQGALWTPIHVAYCSGADISNNKITDVRLLSGPEVLVFGQPGFNQQKAIFYSTIASQGKTPKYQPGALTGALTISDNDIDLKNDAPSKTMSQGVFIIWATGVTGKIAGNTVTNCSRNSIEVLDCYQGSDGTGSFLIEDNKVITAREGIPLPTPYMPNGIIAGWFFDPSGASDPKRNIKYTIANNSIRAFGKTSVGVYVAAADAVVKGNHIVTESPEALPVVLNTSRCQMASNKIEGVGSVGCLVAPLKEVASVGNRLEANDFKLFKASSVDVLLMAGADDNDVIGEGGTVKDDGKGNTVKGLKPPAPK